MKLGSILFVFLFATGILRGQNINDGLLLYYPFNGSTEDQSGNNYDGTPFGIGYTSDRFGNPNSAASFNGSSDYVNFPNISTLKPDLPVSFSFWIKYTSDNYQDRVVFNTSFEEDINTGVFFTSGASTNQYALGFGNGSPFYSASSIENYVSNGTVETNEWTHLTIVVTSPSDMQIYVGCEELGGSYGGSGGDLVYSDLPGCIGRHDQNTSLPAFYLKGAIDDFRYWNRTITPEEVGILCNLNSPNCPEILNVQNNEGCTDTELLYDFELSGTSNSFTEILWTFADGSTSNSLSPIKTYNSTGSFPYTLQVTMDDGCVYESQGISEITEAPTPPVLPESISICEGGNFLMDFSEFSDWDEILDPNGNSVISYSFNEPGIFNFSFNDPCGQIEIPIEVVQINPTELISGTTEYSTCPNISLIPDLSETVSGNTYQWIPVTGLSNPNILNPTINVSQSSDYIVVATGDCGFTDTLFVSVVVNTNTPLQIFGQAELMACSGDVVSPNLQASISGSSYSWQPTTGLSDPTILSPNISVTAPITYTLTATNPCTSDATFELVISINEPLEFTLGPDITICKGDTIEIPGNLNSNGGVLWNNSSSLSSLDIPNPLAFPSATTEYTVSISNECETINESINIIVNEAPDISGISELQICEGDTAYAEIHNTGNFDVTSWHWSPAVGIENTSTPNPGIFNKNDATYHVSGTNSCGTDAFEVNLQVYTLDAELDLDSIVCPGTPIPLSAHGAFSYSWFPADVIDQPHDSITTAHIYYDQLIQLQLSGGTCVKMISDFVHVYHDIGFSQLDPVYLFAGEDYDLRPLESLYNISFGDSPLVSFMSDTIIALPYIDTNGCEFSLYLPVIIEPALFIPNSFTPDGDGLNDIFKAVGVNINNFEMRIYNRYGKLVFQSNALSHGWNGGIDGYYCPDDIYNYVVEYSYQDTEVKVKRGFVTLLR